MTHRAAEDSPAASPSRSRCKCGHLPTHHMVVLPIGTSDSFRLDPSGPCSICGEGGCRHYAPGGV